VKHRALFLGTVLFLALGPITGAQETETVRVTHRFDWRRSVDSQYQGLVYGYWTGAWKLAPAEGGWTNVEARYYQATESKRNNALFEKPVEAERVARFRISPQGTMAGFEGDGVPYYRNFPAPLPADAGPGSVWTGEGELVGDFLGTGLTTRIPILIEYRWEGPGTYGDTAVINVKTQYALRYQRGRDPSGDPTLSRADGTHIGVVSFDAGSRKVVFIRETAKELFTSTSGKKIGNDGILLTFFEGVPALGTSSLVATIARALEGKPSDARAETPAVPPTITPAPADPTPPPSDARALSAAAALARLPTDAPELKVEEDPRGVKLTLENLRFVADQAVLLPGETKRLTAIADLLKTVPGRNLLVVGHTAAVGTVASQEALSVDRALSIVEKLKSSGIPAGRLLYEGRGGSEPIADNATEAGRAQNRRVEIIILDQ
jgi:outer membrane protein OmpA-like peptidoglycan-associated protein